MIEDLFMPLDCQFDSGFGATACAFHGAAKAIDSPEYRLGFGMNINRLPVLYLYRHASELYLKSVLTILHRRFRSHYPKIKKDDFPLIPVGSNFKKIFDVHSISALYREFRGILSFYAEDIKAIAIADWTYEPEGLNNLVDLIDDADKASTMFRYPATSDVANDENKSSFKRIDPMAAMVEAQNRASSGNAGIVLLAMTHDDEMVETYIHDEEAMQEVLKALRKLSETLSSAHFGMIHEFVGFSIKGS